MLESPCPHGGAIEQSLGLAQSGLCPCPEQPPRFSQEDDPIPSAETAAGAAPSGAHEVAAQLSSAASFLSQPPSRCQLVPGAPGQTRLPESQKAFVFNSKHRASSYHLPFLDNRATCHPSRPLRNVPSVTP